jgi:hypothetical protein
MDEIESKLIQIETEGDYDEWFNKVIYRVFGAS